MSALMFFLSLGELSGVFPSIFLTIPTPESKVKLAGNAVPYYISSTQLEICNIRKSLTAFTKWNVTHTI